MSFSPSYDASDREEIEAYRLQDWIQLLLLVGIIELGFYIASILGGLRIAPFWAAYNFLLGNKFFNFEGRVWNLFHHPKQDWEY